MIYNLCEFLYKQDRTDLERMLMWALHFSNGLDDKTKSEQWTHDMIMSAIWQLDKPA